MSSNERRSGLMTLDPQDNHSFHEPAKRINDGPDVTFFQTSKAYTDIMTFILQLNAAMFPRTPADGASSPQTWDLGSPSVPFPPAVTSLRALLDDLTSYIDQAPPDTGPRRFGNIAFRHWHDLLTTNASSLLSKHLPPLTVTDPNAMTELRAYLLGSFGSSQRLDYGTGHELSFLALLAGLWKLGAFASNSTPETATDGATERAIVLGLLAPYLTLIRRLITTYTLEPAGSHGVWGLDDHSFAPYIFGSAQLGPPVPPGTTSAPTEGSLPTAPSPNSITSPALVTQYRETNLYFDAVSFIADVKKGPFWEHSPMLYDISGVRAGWGKINKGMLRMYAAEVLAKFPVVQHFPFGGLFRWERDPGAPDAPVSAHVHVQPAEGAKDTMPLRKPAGGGAQMNGAAPAGMPPTKAPWAAGGAPAAVGPGGMPPTRAPWASGGPAGGGGAAAGRQPPMGPTKAPWARDA